MELSGMSPRPGVSRGTGRGQHGVGGRIHVLAVLHLVGTAFPVDVEARHARV
uniref:Uncharacterized protein n=1 Tax=Anguilla anguilla TaxID=7936 RepID=A0A0E9PME8_ANGAN